MTDYRSDASPVAATLPSSEERPLKRYQSKDLFRLNREIEIEHQGRIYRMRVTQLNKLILTA
ncbi:MAG: hemin uptake protein HemP [Burkholderiaceae bacterium]|jgi:hemin uptake protein HemP